MLDERMLHGPAPFTGGFPDVAWLIDRNAVEAPGRAAVRAPDATLTYGELAARSEAVASRLTQMGVAPGDLVALCMERSAALVVAALGIVKAGGAYVAMDPGYPDDRLRFVLQDCGAGVVVAGADLHARLDHDLAPLDVTDAKSSGPIGVGVAAGRQGRSPDDLAYVVYTSGSTGEPKGVMVEHASLANLIDWHCRAFGVTAADRTTLVASPGFDAAVWEMWPTLAAGACLHVVPESVRTDPVGLRDWLVSERITISFLPTALAETVLGLPWPGAASLRHLLTGGEALSRAPAPGLPFALTNNYGLSETAVVATSGLVAPADGQASSFAGPPSIGRPIDGVEVRVVDDELRAVETGQPGELVVGGVSVARGYLNRPRLTAERFVADPSGGGRLYRTGDRVRQRPDGQFDFLGRFDDQVSIRGVRVEPGEIAAVLDRHPGVRSSVVVAVGETTADLRLVAYVVAASGRSPGDEELWVHLARLLPEAMIPAAYVWLDELPVGPHGKVERALLPALTDDPGTDRAAPSCPDPHTGIEATTASIVAELLGVGRVSVLDNFFLLGGHSMLGAQLIVRLEDLFGVEITLRSLFDHPTVSEIAVEVERQLAAARTADAVPA